MQFLLTLLILSLIILVHEFGHFFAARKCGVWVEEFAMGMGPAIWSKKSGDTVYSVRLFPIGGFCKLYGEDGAEEANNKTTDNGESSAVGENLNENHKTAINLETADNDENADDESIIEPNGNLNHNIGTVRAKDERAFFNKSVLQRVIVLAAGSCMNFVLAFIVMYAVTAFIGIDIPVVATVMEGYPAEQAGLRAGDRILEFNGVKTNTYDEFVLYRSGITGESVSFTVKRDGEIIKIISGTKYLEDEDRYIAGFSYTGENIGVNIIEAVPAACSKIIFWFKATGIIISRMVAEGTLKLDTFTGILGLPPLLDSVYTDTVEAGAAAGAGTFQIVGSLVITMAQLLAMLSANIGAVNLLPLPALDGGRLMFVFAEGVTKRRIAAEKEAVVHFVGFVLLMVFFVIIAANDWFLYYGPKE